MSHDAYIERIAVLDEKDNIDRNVDYLEDFSDDPRGYQVIDTQDPRHSGGHKSFMVVQEISKTD